MLSDFVILHRQSQVKELAIFKADGCDLLSDFVILHRQSQASHRLRRPHECCDLLSDFVILHRQSQGYLDILRGGVVVICFQIL